MTGFVGTDTQANATTGTLTFTSPATQHQQRGQLRHQRLRADGHGNYTFVQAAGNATALTITAATLTYTANTASRTYGATNPAFSGTVTGFVGTDTQANATTGTLTFTSPATSASNVGSYAINGSGLTASNYTFVQAAGNATALTITAATLTYTANTASRTYGAANPAFSGTVTGFVGTDTQANATTGTLTFTSAATSTSNVGSYAINGSGLTARQLHLRAGGGQRHGADDHPGDPADHGQQRDDDPGRDGAHHHAPLQRPCQRGHRHGPDPADLLGAGRDQQQRSGHLYHLLLGSCGPQLQDQLCEGDSDHHGFERPRLPGFAVLPQSGAGHE